MTDNGVRYRIPVLRREKNDSVADYVNAVEYPRLRSTRLVIKRKTH